MPPKITRVKWSAQDIPWGLSFDETNGTFTGTPEDEGKYTVPVTVQTNYGKDMKDVVVMVKRKYPYYAYVPVFLKDASIAGSTLIVNLRDFMLQNYDKESNICFYDNNIQNVEYYILGNISYWPFPTSSASPTYKLNDIMDRVITPEEYVISLRGTSYSFYYDIQTGEMVFTALSNNNQTGDSIPITMYIKTNQGYSLWSFFCKFGETSSSGTSLSIVRDGYFYIDED